jgi:hypothetical protein
MYIMYYVEIVSLEAGTQLSAYLMQQNWNKKKAPVL